MSTKEEFTKENKMRWLSRMYFSVSDSVNHDVNPYEDIAAFLDAWNEKSKKARHYITTMLRLQMEKEIVKYTGSLIATDLEVNIPAATGHTEDEDATTLALAKEALGDLDPEQLAALSFPGDPEDDVEEDHMQEHAEDQVQGPRQETPGDDSAEEAPVGEITKEATQ